MAQSKILHLTSWNTCGVKDTPDFPNKCRDIFLKLEKLSTEIAFLQETHIGFQDIKILEMLEGWDSFFTVSRSSRSKGVAILINKTVPFEYICHDEDYGGSYIVLFCRLYGELFTLVNVYNHKADREVLHRLAEYLKETKAGMLVVGGDFNTVLNPDLDRLSSALHKEHSSLRHYLEDFTTSLNLKDTWAHLHPTDLEYTRYQTISDVSYSRLDMFFMPEDTLKHMQSCKIKEEKLSDHNPVVLKIKVGQSDKKTPEVASALEKFEYCPDLRPGKISGAEILSAIKSLSYTGQQEVDDEIDKYRKNCCSFTEKLKPTYNRMMKTKGIPKTFKKRFKSCRYLTFVTIVAKRLSVYLRPSFRGKHRNAHNSHIRITFQEAPRRIRSSFLNKALSSLKSIPHAPPRDFSILHTLLPEDKGPSGYCRILQPGCPLTQPILTLVLNHLAKFKLGKEYSASICNHRQILYLNVEEQKIPIVQDKVKEFETDSNIRLKILKLSNFRYGELKLLTTGVEYRIIK